MKGLFVFLSVMLAGAASAANLSDGNSYSEELSCDGVQHTHSGDVKQHVSLFTNNEAKTTLLTQKVETAVANGAMLILTPETFDGKPGAANLATALTVKGTHSGVVSAISEPGQYYVEYQFVANDLTERAATRTATLKMKSAFGSASIELTCQTVGYFKP